MMMMMMMMMMMRMMMVMKKNKMMMTMMMTMVTTMMMTMMMARRLCGWGVASASLARRWQAETRRCGCSLALGWRTARLQTTTREGGRGERRREKQVRSVLVAVLAVDVAVLHNK